MIDAVVLTCLGLFALVAFASLVVIASMVKNVSEREERRDRVMALLLTKTINAAVVPDIDQVSRIKAENGDESLKDNPQVGPPMFEGTPGTPYETVGDARSDQID